MYRRGRQTQKLETQCNVRMFARKKKGEKKGGQERGDGDDDSDGTANYGPDLTFRKSLSAVTAAVDAAASAVNNDFADQIRFFCSFFASLFAFKGCD